MWRYWLGLITIAGMMVGLFVSRSLLSISMFIFIANGIINPSIKAFLKTWAKDKLAIAQFILFLVPLVTLLWSSDKEEWFSHAFIKFPLAFLFFGFYAIIPLKEKHFKWLSHFFIVLMFGGTLWSLIIYLQNPAKYHELYRQAKVIPTLFDSNHIYFSFTVVIALLLITKLFISCHTKLRKVIYVVTAIWLIAYLHILSAKTGLLCLYFSLLVLGLYFLIKIKQKLVALFLLFIVASLPLMAYKLLPTFKNRIGYILYDFSHYSRGNYIEGLSDGSRYRSLLAGRDIFLDNPLTGKGFGDIKKETNRWYNVFHPQIKDYERMLPSSELLLYACGAGIIGAILFLIAMLLPWKLKPLKNDISWKILLSILLLFFLYEVSLEGQFGVFIYGFFTWWWFLFTQKKISV